MYPLKQQRDYTELRYSLRSIEPYADEVVIVGSKLPEWIINVTWINLGDIEGKKQLSIRRKIITALEYTERFLFMNDDVYLLHSPDKNYYWQAHLANHKSESGGQKLMKELTEYGAPVKDFDGHYPLVYDQRFRQASEHFTSDCIIKSLYCNYWEIPGTQIKDCKMINAKSIPDLFLPALSTGQYSIKNALPILNELFPNKSKYELWADGK